MSRDESTQALYERAENCCLLQVVRLVTRATIAAEYIIQGSILKPIGRRSKAGYSSADRADRPRASYVGPLESVSRCALLVGE